ncbi:MAG: YkgJ family cysteine cluster protein [Verrucomicrobiota bacterium]|jgi:Fe-S-cluster containining protein|nr:YkgJ family cysteine cluster protein [Verrucomicrobiota bacterium]
MDGFVCQRCGACCRWPGSVLLTDADIVAAAAGLQLPEETFIAHYTQLARNRAQLTLKEQVDGSCLLLDASGSCRIYDGRPRQCREFPDGWRVEGCPACSSQSRA